MSRIKTVKRIAKFDGPRGEGAISGGDAFWISGKGVDERRACGCSAQPPQSNSKKGGRSKTMVLPNTVLTYSVVNQDPRGQLFI